MSFCVPNFACTISTPRCAQLLRSTLISPVFVRLMITDRSPIVARL
ncbi:hypothetical protein BH09PSE5_BH09PSE5_30800 [soil metagenome]